MNFDKLKNLLESAVNDKNIPCADIIVTHKGKEVFRYFAGTSDDERKVPIKGDELYFLYSGTKVITCTAMMQLVEKGIISLDDEVGKYIPEYKDLMVKTPNGVEKCKTPMTIKHLFTMTSGLDYNLERGGICELREKNPKASTLEMVKTFVQEPLEFEPGAHYSYSLSHDVLAAILEIVTGMSFGEYLKKNIFDVCGMQNTGFEINDHIRSRMCSQYVQCETEEKFQLTEKKNQFVLTDNYQCGGAGLISCVNDYGRFVANMACGEALLKRETIDLMRQKHLGPQAEAEFAEHKLGYNYGLGVRTNQSMDFSPKGEFGWDGAAGAYVLIDPDNELGVFFATHMLCCNLYVHTKLHPSIRDAVYDAVL